MRFILALFAVVTVPLIALAIAAAPYYNQMGVTNPIDMLQIAGPCFTDPNLQGDAYNFCDSLREFHWLGLLAIITMALGLFVLFFSSIMSLIFAGTRSGLAFSFRTVSLVALLLLSVITLFQAILVVASIYLGMSYFMGIMIPYLIIAAAIGGVVLTAIVIGSLFEMFKTARSSAIGIPLEDGEAPELREMIDEIATQLETTPPDNIVLGLEPTFFVTSVPTSTPFAKNELTGETIYLSLPLMRVLSTEETKSIIGHELGHFTGADTEFSKKFAPAYAGINHARYNLANQGHIGLQLGAMPINTILNFVLGVFEPAEKKISREREYRADEIGASVGSAQSLSSALVKLSTFFHIWQVESHDAINRVVVGRGSKNLSRNFVDRGRYDTNLDEMSEFTAKSLDTEVEHPIDTHPVTSKRIEALGIDPAPLIDPTNFKASLFPTDTIAELCPDLQIIEEKVTSGFQQLIAHQYGVDQREEMKVMNAFANLLSMWLAKMVTIDGHVDEEEINTAQLKARDYDPAFDATSFRELCRHPEDIPETDKLMEWGNQMLTTEGATKLKTILAAIAEADGVIDPDERTLLDRLETELKGDDTVSEPTPDPTEKRGRRRGRR